MRGQDGEVLPKNEAINVFVSKKFYDLEQKIYSPQPSLTMDEEKILNDYYKTLEQIEKRETLRLKEKYPKRSGRIRYSHASARSNVDVNLVEGEELNIEAFKASRDEYANSEFILEDDKYICGSEVEKMSKSKFNVVNPDHIVERYGADTLRLYEMFLGPLEQAKPWDMDGIEGVHRFLKKLWRLYHNSDNQFEVSEEKATKEELKSLHKTIKKIREDIERYSFNTGVSAFMICVNELNDLKCNKREILEPLAVLISPYAPHIAEELWNRLGHEGTVSQVAFPEFEASHLVESNHKYPVSFNGKMRFMLELPADMGKEEIEKVVLAHEEAQKWLEGKTPKKMIVIPKKIVNVVI
jgi:leucyl-tRNA synthetase